MPKVNAAKFQFGNLRKSTRVQWKSSIIKKSKGCILEWERGQWLLVAIELIWLSQQKPDDSTTTVHMSKKADKQSQFNGNTNFLPTLHISCSAILFTMNSYLQKKEAVRWQAHKMKGLKYLYDCSQLSPQRPRANISFPENILKHHFQNYHEFLWSFCLGQEGKIHTCRYQLA